jgi:hypothetical protein
MILCVWASGQSAISVGTSLLLHVHRELRPPFHLNLSQLLSVIVRKFPIVTASQVIESDIKRQQLAKLSWIKTTILIVDKFIDWHWHFSCGCSTNDLM